jgi:hypothetical protein
LNFKKALKTKKSFLYQLSTFRKIHGTLAKTALKQPLIMQNYNTVLMIIVMVLKQIRFGNVLANLKVDSRNSLLNSGI